MTTPTRAQVMSNLFSELAVQKEVPTIADALEFRRDQYGLSQADFAFVLGIQPSHYSEVINGKRSLPMTAMKAAYKIGVPAEILLCQ